jgi:hypothetical protein
MNSEDTSPMPNVFPVNPDDPGKSVRGRFWYAHAVSQYVNGFCESLRDDVLYSYEFFDCLASGRPISESMRESAQASFDQWLRDWGIVDEWLMDSCRHTLQAWAIKVHDSGREVLDNCHPLPVLYGPNESNLATALGKFAPVLDQPYPIPLNALSPEERSILETEPVTLRIYEAAVERESAAKFKKRMQAQFDAQLKHYADQCESRILEHRNVARDAAWTALFQFGLTPKRIEAWEFKRSGDAFSHARIQQAVREFANAIGLTLRKPKAGRNAKGKSASASDIARERQI